MVFQKFVSEKSEIHYWSITHDIKEISEKILKFQRCVPSQSPTNLPICCHLVYQCFCTEKKNFTDHLSLLGKTSTWKNFSFGHCPNHLTPPPHPPNLGNLVLFFWTSKTTFCAYDRKNSDDDNDACNDNYDDNNGYFDDNYEHID